MWGCMCVFVSVCMHVGVHKFWIQILYYALQSLSGVLIGWLNCTRQAKVSKVSELAYLTQVCCVCVCVYV